HRVKSFVGGCPVTSQGYSVRRHSVATRFFTLKPLALAFTTKPFSMRLMNERRAVSRPIRSAAATSRSPRPIRPLLRPSYRHFNSRYTALSLGDSARQAGERMMYPSIMRNFALPFRLYLLLAISAPSIGWRWLPGLPQSLLGERARRPPSNSQLPGVVFAGPAL